MAFKCGILVLGGKSFHPGEAVRIFKTDSGHYMYHSWSLTMGKPISAAGFLSLATYRKFKEQGQFIKGETNEQ